MSDITETSPGYEVNLRLWQKIRDALEGEDVVKDRGVDHLPKPRGMKKIDYANYLARSNFYAVADRTLRGLTGLVFRVEPVFNLPSRLEPMRRVASPEGFTMRQLVREALREVLSLGRYGCMVDMPTDVTPGTQPVPYIATWKAEDIFNWEQMVDVNTGVRKLTRVVLLEEPTNTGDTTVRWIRELFIDPEDGFYKQQRWVEIEPETSGRAISRRRLPQEVDFVTGNFEEFGEPVMPLRMGAPMDEIPFWFVNPYDLRARVDKAPFLDMVNVNFGHYRNSADYETALHMIGSPTPYAFGMPAEQRPTAIGPFVIWHATAKDVKVGMLEYTGQGVATIRLGMQDKENRMAVLGARLIRADSERDNIAAETTRLEAREETSVLVAVTESVAEAFTKAIEFAATWVGADPEESSVKLNRDFVETRLEPAALIALVKVWQDGAISDEILHGNLQKGEIVPSDVSLGEERLRAEEQMAKRRMDTADREAAAAKRMAAAVPPTPAPGGNTGE